MTTADCERHGLQATVSAEGILTYHEQCPVCRVDNLAAGLADMELELSLRTSERDAASEHVAYLRAENARLQEAIGDMRSQLNNARALLNPSPPSSSS